MKTAQCGGKSGAGCGEHIRENARVLLDALGRGQHVLFHAECFPTPPPGWTVVPNAFSRRLRLEMDRIEAEEAVA